MPLLMDHILVEIDPEAEDTYFGIGSAPGAVSSSSLSSFSVPVPIEAKLRSLAVGLLYDVCRVQKFSVQDLREIRCGTHVNAGTDVLY